MLERFAVDVRSVLLVCRLVHCVCVSHFSRPATVAWLRTSDLGCGAGGVLASRRCRSLTTSLRGWPFRLAEQRKHVGLAATAGRERSLAASCGGARALP